MSSKRLSSSSLAPGQRTLGSFFSKPPSSSSAPKAPQKGSQQPAKEGSGKSLPVLDPGKNGRVRTAQASNENSNNIGDGKAGQAARKAFEGEQSLKFVGVRGEPSRSQIGGSRVGFRSASSLLRDGSGPAGIHPSSATLEQNAGGSAVDGGPSEELREQWRRKKEERVRKLEKQKADRHRSVQSSIEACLKRTRNANGTALSSESLPLPDECWRIIFAYLPRQQMRSLRGCCRAWRDVIDAPDFMPHSKRYDTLLSSGQSAASPTDAHGRSAGPLGGGNLRPEERWFVANGVVDVRGMMGALQTGLFQTQPSSLIEALHLAAAEAEKNGQNAAPWTNVLETLKVLSQKVGTSYWCLALLSILFVCEKELLPAVIHALLSGQAGASRADAVEFLHLLLAVPRTATWIAEPLPNLRHIDSALQYHLLAEEVSCRERQVQFHLSAEQHDIIDTDLRPEQVMVVTAFAGTGKTTTLVEYTRRRPGKSFAYLVFNRSVMLEAEQKFCKNTKCVNFHRLAYAKVGWLYKHKLTGSQPAPHIVARALGLRGGPDAFFALKTLDTYLQSADDEISEEHVPPAAARASARTAGNGATRAAQIVDLAKRLWEKMRDKQSTEVFMTHGGYLKLYQLTRPRLDYQYDVVMLDEAQDASPVMADIVLRQSGCSKIIVGDPHQQIYGFMGAINVMKTVRDEGKGVVERQLTRSFRFGPQIAAVCNSLLHVKGERSSVIGARGGGGIPNSSSSAATAVAFVGAARLDDLAGVPPPGGPATSSTSTLTSAAGGGALTLVARANATLFEAAASTRARALGFVGGLRDYRFDLLLDTWHLMKGDLGRIKDGYLRTFKNWQELEETARHTDDVELRSRINIVKRNFADLDRKIESIEKRDVGPDLSKATVTFTTAHKAKGLEFDTVVLAEDFVAISQLVRDGDKFLMPVVDSMSDELEYAEVQVDEINLVYVAASRARKRLLVNADLNALLRAEACGERNAPLLLRSVAGAVPMVCVHCKRKCGGDLMMVYRRSDNLPGNTAPREGATVGSWQVHVCEPCAKSQDWGIKVACIGSATVASLLHVFEK